MYNCPDMPPRLSPYSRIFAARAAIAGISLATALGLAGCPRPASQPPPAATPAQIASVFTVGTIALQTTDPRALDKLNEAVRLAPQEPAIWANLGLLHLRAGQNDEAATDLDKANSLLPPNTPPAARASIESMLALVADSKGDVAGAATHLKTAVSLNPEDLLNRYALSLQQEKAQDDPGALATMQAIVHDHPDNIEALLQTARMAAKQNNVAVFTAALTSLKSFSSAWSAQAKDYLVQMKAAAQSGKVQRAAITAQYLTNVLKQDSAYRQSHALLTPPEDKNGNAVVGTPLEQFLVLPNIADTPAPPDMTVTFAEQQGTEEKEKRRKGEKETQSTSEIPQPSTLNPQSTQALYGCPTKVRRRP